MLRSNLLLAVMLSLAPIYVYAGSQAIFHYAGKDWYIGYEVPTGKIAIREMVPVGETVDNWTEMFTLETLPPLEVTPKEYVGKFVSNIESKIHKKVHYHIFNATNKSVAFEWWVSSDNSYAQHEWYKLIKYSNETIVSRYTTKKVAAAKLNASRKNWQQYIIGFDPKLN